MVLLRRQQLNQQWEEWQSHHQTNHHRHHHQCYSFKTSSSTTSNSNFVFSNISSIEVLQLLELLHQCYLVIQSQILPYLLIIIINNHNNNNPIAPSRPTPQLTPPTSSSSPNGNATPASTAVALAQKFTPQRAAPLNPSQRQEQINREAERRQTRTSRTTK